MTQPDTNASEVQPFEVGDLIEGRYLVESLMASTNFSWVYRAVQRSTRQPVVIKVLRTHHVGDASSEEIEQRFRRETSIYARVHHPNVVRLLDTGSDEGRLYLVLDYIEGVSLSQVIHEEGRIEPFEAKRLLGQCLGALAVAHEKGIVHRDFKPANVMITSTGTERNAVLLDFGLAGLEETLRSSTVPMGRARRITSPGMVMGTFWYMPPEVLEGVVTVQSDVFSWGMVAIECLAGERPNPDRGDIRHALTEVPKPIELPEWLARQPLGKVLARATAIDREARYTSAVDALADLRRCPVADLATSIPLPAPRLRRTDTADDDLTGMVQVGLSAAQGPLSVELAPSMLVAELGQLAERAPMPASPHLGPPIDQDLDALFEDYLQLTRALHQNPLITRAQLHERAVRDAEWLRAALGCSHVRFRLVIDEEHIRLQPVPID